jgi:nucleotide-binding universal stress UspA family protein
MAANILLIPTDFSDVTINAVNYGASMAKVLNYKVTLAHILTKESISKLKKEKVYEEGAVEKLKALAEEIKNKYNVEVDFIIKRGSLFSSLSEIAKEIDASILLFGTPGKSAGIFNYFTSADAFKLVSKTDCPNIVIQKGVDYPESIKNVIFPVSTTTKIGPKIFWARFMAKAFNAKVHIFKLYEPSDAAQIKMRTLMNKFIKPEFDKHNIEFFEKEATREGNFGEQLLKYSDSIKADMIIIMNDPDPLNYIQAYEESLLFNPYQIPIMCVNFIIC